MHVQWENTYFFNAKWIFFLNNLHNKFIQATPMVLQAVTNKLSMVRHLLLSHKSDPREPGKNVDSVRKTRLIYRKTFLKSLIEFFRPSQFQYNQPRLREDLIRLRPSKQASNHQIFEMIVVKFAVEGNPRVFPWAWVLTPHRRN